MRIPRLLLVLFAASLIFFRPFGGLGIRDLPAGVVSAASPEPWKGEFEDICANTGNATSLSKDELRTLIERCKRLEPAIETLDETTRKVYRKRLKMCKDLYAYVLAAMEAREDPAQKK